MGEIEFYLWILGSWAMGFIGGMGLWMLKKPEDFVKYFPWWKD